MCLCGCVLLGCCLTVNITAWMTVNHQQAGVHQRREHIMGWGMLWLLLLHLQKVSKVTSLLLYVHLHTVLQFSFTKKNNLEWTVLSNDVQTKERQKRYSAEMWDLHVITRMYIDKLCEVLSELTNIEVENTDLFILDQHLRKSYFQLCLQKIKFLSNQTTSNHYVDI